MMTLGRQLYRHAASATAADLIRVLSPSLTDTDLSGMLSLLKRPASH